MTSREVVPPATLCGVGGTIEALDIDRLLFDVATSFNPLHRDSLLECQAVGTQGDHVLLNVALPRDMTRFFVTFLESMTGFFRVMDHRARVASAQHKTIDPVAIAERENFKADFINEVCTIFDGFTGQGLSVKEALKQTNLALKAVSHPWATYDTIQRTLRAKGRFRGKKTSSHRKE
ncbi:hypothetical protein [Oryzomonas rubra]|uniref:Uncharacterized protein n=1 Tax=Oryzomonas rubra TaxID=2509454 RepID=A0A5A9XQT2_9BACT|nr:hypothetical protein [Oryzomonas rubra]KAA0895180.1 hypothetical protein ET418_01275 [Oryzomonas rubra]